MDEQSETKQRTIATASGHRSHKLLSMIAGVLTTDQQSQRSEQTTRIAVSILSIIRDCLCSKLLGF